MSRYDHLDRAALIRLLERRDAERQLGLVWEREEIDADQAVNDDFVALELDAALSHGPARWDNLIIEGDNYDALRALRISHKGAIRCIYIDPPYNTRACLHACDPRPRTGAGAGRHRHPAGQRLSASSGDATEPARRAAAAARRTG